MNKFLKYSFLVFALALGTGPRAHAEGIWDILFDHDKPKHYHHQDPPPRAPEVDPALAISGVTLVAGSLTVLRARRRK